MQCLAKQETALIDFDKAPQAKIHAQAEVMKQVNTGAVYFILHRNEEGWVRVERGTGMKRLVSN